MTPTTGQELYDAALGYLAAGWTPTPLRDKVPTQKRWVGITPSGADCWSWWIDDPRHNGIGIVCGAASGNLLVVDVEKEMVADPQQTARVMMECRRRDPEAADKLLASFRESAASTPSEGRHLFFAVTDGPAPANAKLAFRGSGKDAVLLAETRGEGGQVAAPPGEGREWLGTAGPGSATPVTVAQLDHILAAFRHIDESGVVQSVPKPRQPYEPDQHRRPTVADAWSDALLDGAITWADVLDPGWTPNGYDDEGRSLWVRPDYGDKTKASYSAKGFERWSGGPRPVLVVHSTSVPHLPSGSDHRLTPARVWALCNFGGDESAALAALEAAAVDGEVDPRIVTELPPAVLERARALAESRDDTLPAFTPDATGAPDATWWDEREWLRHIHTFARSRMVSPFALLAVTLVRVAANTPPHLTLPPIVGGRGSLNLFGVLVGPSGAGKSAVCAASDELLPWADTWTHIGSGEGLVHTYAARVKADDPDNPGKPIWKVEQHTYRATGIVDEIDTLTALGARQGATLLPTLRTAWSGASLGFGYADPTKRLKLDAHTYRLGLVVGAQPTRCAALFDEADAGTPQRFIWAPLVDPDAPDLLPDNPGPLPQPRLRFDGFNPVMEVCQELTDTVMANRRQALRTGNTNGLDGHALLNRVKVAATIALMEGRFDVTDADWELSGRIQATSDAARAWVQRVIAREREAVADKRAAGKAREAVVVDATITDARVGRVGRVIARAVQRAGEDGLTRNQVREKVASRDRDDFEAGLQFALAASWVAEVERPQARSDDPVRVFIPGREAV